MFGLYNIDEKMSNFVAKLNEIRQYNIDEKIQKYLLIFEKQILGVYNCTRIFSRRIYGQLY